MRPLERKLSRSASRGDMPAGSPGISRGPPSAPRGAQPRSDVKDGGQPDSEVGVSSKSVLAPAIIERYFWCACECGCLPTWKNNAEELHKNPLQMPSYFSIMASKHSLLWLAGATG